MQESEAGRRIAALTAIVQTMIQEVYCGPGGEGGRAWFDGQLREDEALALAIANELDEAALAHAFAWAAAASGSSGEEIAASPVVAHLDPGQRERVRVALLAVDEADEAAARAIRATDGNGAGGQGAGGQDGAGAGAAARIAAAEDGFLGRIEADVRAAQPAWTAGAAGAERAARLRRLPEPWRRHAGRRLPELRARLEAAFGLSRGSGQDGR